MHEKIARSGWDLQTGGMLGFAAAAGWTVTMERGQAWLTIEGHSQDKWLLSGERFIIPDSGHVLIEADQPTRLRLDPPPASALARLGAGCAHALRRTGRALVEASLYSSERLGSPSAR